MSSLVRLPAQGQPQNWDLPFNAFFYLRNIPCALCCCNLQQSKLQMLFKGLNDESDALLTKVF